MLKEAEAKYREGKQRRWIYSVLGVMFLGLFAYFAAIAVYEIDHTIYDTKKIDTILRNYTSNFDVKDALTEELFIIAYSYNAGIPRFYTKTYASDPNLAQDYDLSMHEVARATSATPLYFDPLSRNIKNGKQNVEEILIDGSIIANNPSLYATSYAKHVLKKKNVRVVAFGFKPRTDSTEDLSVMNAIEWMERMDQILVDTEVQTSDYFT